MENSAKRDSVAADAEARMHAAEMTDVCPYLPDRTATLRFGNGLRGGLHYRALLDRGYRRNGLYLYRPVCSGCRECKVLRVPVEEFQMSESQRRVWRRGRRIFRLAVEPPSYTPEKAALYQRYLLHQHDDEGEAKDMDEERYTHFLVQSCLGGDTLELQLWEGPKLAGIGIFDVVPGALSSVYFFFSPESARWSPGTFSALCEIQLARTMGMRHYYLGYYIRECPAMSYKNRFRPCEIKDPDDGHWTRFDPE